MAQGLVAGAVRKSLRPRSLFNAAALLPDPAACARHSLCTSQPSHGQDERAGQPPGLRRRLKEAMQEWLSAQWKVVILHTAVAVTIVSDLAFPAGPMSRV